MERAILAGDSETGICVMKLVKELDAGPVYQTRRFPLDREITLDQLARRLSTLANEALGTELALGETAFCSPIEQVGKATYAHKLTIEDLRIDWAGSTAEVMRKIRLGRAWTTLQGARFKIFAASEFTAGEVALGQGEVTGVLVGTGSGAIELKSVQPQNKRIMEARDWINGMKQIKDLRFI